jgi:hypothetical protein
VIGHIHHAACCEHALTKMNFRSTERIRWRWWMFDRLTKVALKSNFSPVQNFPSCQLLKVFSATIVLTSLFFFAGCANESPTSMESALTRGLRAQNAESRENYQPARSPGFNDLLGGR